MKAQAVVKYALHMEHTILKMRQLLESDERLRRLERELAGNKSVSYRYLRELGRKEPVISFYMDLVDLMHGKIKFYTTWDDRDDLARHFRFEGKYDGVGSSINIKIKKVLLDGYVRLANTPNKPNCFAEMVAVKGASLAPYLIRVVRGYSHRHIYGRTLAGWQTRNTLQAEWINHPEKMLQAMADYVKEEAEIGRSS